MMRTTVILAFVMISTTALAEELDKYSKEALEKTVELLTDPALREKAADETPTTRFVDKQAKSVAGSQENYEEMYSIAAEIFKVLVKEEGGDVEKLKARMLKAKKDPEAFARELDRKMPRVRERIRQLSHSATATGMSIDNGEIKRTPGAED